LRFAYAKYLFVLPVYCIRKSRIAHPAKRSGCGIAGRLNKQGPVYPGRQADASPGGNMFIVLLACAAGFSHEPTG
jgi:hypothetical protein